MTSPDPLALRQTAGHNMKVGITISFKSLFYYLRIPSTNTVAFSQISKASRMRQVDAGIPVPRPPDIGDSSDLWTWVLGKLVKLQIIN